jgi:hypothetical protein
MFQSLVNIYNIFAGIFVLAKGPQHLPSSYGLLATTLVAYALARIGVAAYEVPIGAALNMGLVNTAVTVGIILVLLAVRGVSFRATQMLTAFAGIGAGFGFAVIIALGIISMVPEVPLFAGLITVVTFPLTCINILINAHLFRESLSTSLAVGVGVALVLLFTAINVTSRFDPTVQPAPGASARMTPSPQRTPEQ